MARNAWMVILVLALAAGIGRAQQSAPLRLIQTVPLPGVRGRIDHFDVDLKGRRLFMSALGNNTVEVFDLRSNELVHSIDGLQEPQGVTYAPASNRIFVANGGDGTCRVFSGESYKLLKTVHLSSDADDTRYEASTRRVYVGYGDDENAGLAILDGTSGDLLSTIKLPGHPESFQLEDFGPRIFVNIRQPETSLPCSTARQERAWQRGISAARRTTFPWRSMKRTTGCSSSAARRQKFSRWIPAPGRSSTAFRASLMLTTCGTTRRASAFTFRAAAARLR